MAIFLGSVFTVAAPMPNAKGNQKYKTIVYYGDAWVYVRVTLIRGYKNTTKELKDKGLVSPGVSTKHTLSCMYINVRSVVHKLDLLQATISAYEPDIIGITESWTSDKILDSELIMPCFAATDQVTRWGRSSSVY